MTVVHIPATASTAAGSESSPASLSGHNLPADARAPSRRAVLAALAWAGPIGLVACSGSLLPKQVAPPTRYTLNGPPGPVMPVVPAAGARVLAVAPWRASPGFDGRQMLYLQQPQVIEAFAQNEWVDTPARMLAPLLVQTLQHSGAFAAVLLLPSNATAAWRLECELLRLYQDFSAQPSVLRLTLRVVLVDTVNRQVLATREFDEQEPALSANPAGGAAAAQRASQRLLLTVAGFCAEQARR